jgi:carbohydrate-binding DOMON domain-containing protein
MLGEKTNLERVYITTLSGGGFVRDDQNKFIAFQINENVIDKLDNRIITSAPFTSLSFNNDDYTREAASYDHLGNDAWKIAKINEQIAVYNSKL